MKLAVLFMAIGVVFSCSNSAEKVLPQPIQQNSMIVINVTFDKKNKFYIDFLDANYRNSVLKFINTKDTFNTITLSTNVKLPTTFSYNVITDGNLIRHDVLALPGDTIDINITNEKIAISFNKPYLEYLNKLLPPLNIKELNSNKSLNGYPDIVNITNAKTRKKIDSLIADGVTRFKIPKHYAEAFTNYNFIRYLFETYKVDYKTDANQLSRFLEDLEQKKEMALKDSIFEKVTSVDIKMLLYNIVRFENAKRNIRQLDVFDGIQHTDPRLHKTQAISGFLLDLVDIESRTILEKENKLVKIAPYINADMLAKSKKITTLSLGDTVLLAMLTDISGRTTSLKNILSSNNKQLVLLDFWASWCVPCVAELPSLKRLAKKMDQKMQVISISIDQDSSKWKEGCDRHQLLTHSYLIQGGKNNPLIRFFAIDAIPRYLLLDGKGSVISDDFYRPSDPKFEMALLETYRGLQ